MIGAVLHATTSRIVKVATAPPGSEATIGDGAVALVAGWATIAGAFVVRLAVARRLRQGSAGGAGSRLSGDGRAYGALRNEESKEGKGHSHVRVYPERWLMLLVYAMNMASSTIMCGSLMSSQLPAQTLFSVKAYTIITLMSILVFLSFPGTIASSLLYKRYGVKITCSIGLTFSSVAAWMMVTAAYTKSWELEMLAVLLAGLAQPLLNNACTGLSASWFALDSRNLPTAVGSVGAGALASAAFNGLAVTEASRLPFEFFIIAVMVTACAGTFMLIYKESPPTPQAARSRVPRGHVTGAFAVRISTKRSLKHMAMDKNFLILLFCFALDGYGWGIILVTNILQEIGYGQHEADLVVAAASIGSMSALFFSPLCDMLKHRDERWPVWLMQICQVLSFMATVGLSLCLHPGMFPAILGFFFLVGVFTTAAAPFLLELVAEVTFPAPESLSAGVCLTFFGICTFGFVQLSQVMVTPGQAGRGYDSFFWLQNVLFAISVVLLVFVFKADMKRTDCSHRVEDGEEEFGRTGSESGELIDC